MKFSFLTSIIINYYTKVMLEYQYYLLSNEWDITTSLWVLSDLKDTPLIAERSTSSAAWTLQTCSLGQNMEGTVHTSVMSVCLLLVLERAWSALGSSLLVLLFQLLFGVTGHVVWKDHGSKVWISVYLRSRPNQNLHGMIIGSVAGFKTRLLPVVVVLPFWPSMRKNFSFIGREKWRSIKRKCMLGILRHFNVSKIFLQVYKLLSSVTSCVVYMKCKFTSLLRNSLLIHILFMWSHKNHFV